MKKKLLIASFALSGLVNAQCDYKCSYNQDENGNTIHLKQCGEYIDSVKVHKNTLKEMFYFLDSSINYIEEKSKNMTCLDEDCEWMWKLRDKLYEEINEPGLNSAYPWDY